MSARNWDVCPKCNEEAVADSVRLLDKASKSYGKVPPDEYERMIEQARRRSDSPSETMREDYEIGVDSKGHFYVSYRASCEVCDFEFKFKHERDGVHKAPHNL